MVPQRPRALVAAVVTVVLMAAALVVMVDEAGEGAAVLLPRGQRVQELSWELSADPAEDSNDAGFELDYGKESGVGRHGLGQG